MNPSAAHPELEPALLDVRQYVCAARFDLGVLATKAGRTLDEYEFQMLFGVRTEEQERLATEFAAACHYSMMNRVQRAITRNQRAGLPTDYDSLRMPDETRNYLPKLQAMVKEGLVFLVDGEVLHLGLRGDEQG